ncbi:peptidoglycan D,D-transpeptidase FtsI family protein [Streptomyces alkaliterrae]|uniref:Penicillin-binding protein 2 n=1 Tax=Streptomyces alkaliterrae TaxID=2213162 RepID=A0A5P0YJQ3_9ACTN|nr:penicillin-binding protein 2 [Streptomyces alkaliterrae]MBB1252422.1 penicillin-binding protein 2 [Streptomyces alkaliterrae]MBB1258535.1 penicillin-binding protein 2 [Streptomyces alkaliterrae]MQS00468.1 penicillin-binding protein 2 [Streptomyces alkaliterrae]
MNKPLRRVAIFCGLLMLALMVRANWVQFVQADELQSHKDNRRVQIERYAHPRGNIIVEGKAITGSVETTGSDFNYKRVYKNGQMWAPVTGRSSQAFGGTQLEEIYDGILTGNDDRLFFNRTVDMLTGKPREGGSVVTTLSNAAQKAAFDGLQGKKGSVVALNPETGAILAMVSTPSYDPSKIAGNSQNDTKHWVEYTEKNKDEDPMLNRAIRQTYAPGSTFKVITAAAALESGKYDVDKKTGIESPYQLPQSTNKLGNSAYDRLCDDATLRRAMELSCNATFAAISDDVGNEEMIKQAEKFGFNSEVFTPVRAVSSVYPEDNRPQNAMAGIGQASNRATPLQMAMVTAAIANDGKLMKPYMVDRLEGPRSTVEQFKPEEMGQAVSPETARKLQEMMESVVEKGTGSRAKIPGVTVGGKTGTAQRGEENKANPYAWFISYAKSGNGSPVAVAVIVEDSDAARGDISGGGLAAPIAVDVMKAILDGKR